MPRVFKKSIVRYLDADGQRVSADTSGARKIKQKSGKWYGRVPGAAKPVPLCRNKSAAEMMLNELVKKAEFGKAGIVDPFEQHRKRPLSEHLNDYESFLSAKGDGGQHVRDTVARVRRIVEGCRFAFIADVSLSAVQEFLARLGSERPALPPIDPAKEWYTKDELGSALGVKLHCIGPLIRRWNLSAEGQGRRRRFCRQTALALRERLSQPVGPATVNHYVRAVKWFSRWLVKDRRTGDNPLVSLSGMNTDTDVRRTLAPAELQRVLAVARASDRTFRGLVGNDRHHLYLTACVTGYRAGELAVLVPDDFVLDAEPAAVALRAEHTKNGKTAVQPIPADVADALRNYLAGKLAGAPVWPGTWSEDAAEMLCLDLGAASVEYVAEGVNGLEYRDFHSLRHSYMAMLDDAGCTLKEAMQLARHSDPKLTPTRYGKAQLHDLAGKVGLLPDLRNGSPSETNVQKLRATGTDAVADVRMSETDSHNGCSMVAYSAATESDSLTTIEHTMMNDGEKGRKAKPLDLQGLRAIASV